MRVLLVTGLLLIMMSNQSCQGQVPEVGAVIAIAATLQVVQIIREKRTGNANSVASQDCCMVCGECQFPCGDICVPFGSFCTAPKGCACFKEPDEHRSMPLSPLPKSGCEQRFFAPAPFDPISM